MSGNINQWPSRLVRDSSNYHLVMWTCPQEELGHVRLPATTRGCLRGRRRNATNREREMMTAIWTMRSRSEWWMGLSPVTTPLDVTDSLVLLLGAISAIAISPSPRRDHHNRLGKSNVSEPGQNLFGHSWSSLDVERCHQDRYTCTHF